MNISKTVAITAKVTINY